MKIAIHAPRGPNQTMAFVTCSGTANEITGEIAKVSAWINDNVEVDHWRWRNLDVSQAGLQLGRDAETKTAGLQPIRIEMMDIPFFIEFDDPAKAILLKVWLDGE